MRLDDYSIRLVSLIHGALTRRREGVAFRHNMLMHVSPAKTVASLQEHVITLHGSMVTHINQHIREGQTTIARQESMLDALNPMAILRRGYSITRTLPDRSAVRSVKKVTIDQNLEILLRRGRLAVTVVEKTTEVE
jgi:exodeoxyribonuclease VII large subunit